MWIARRCTRCRSSAGKLPASLTVSHMDLCSYFDTEQASQRYGLSESWLAKLRVKGGGRATSSVEGGYSMNRSLSKDWLEAHGARTHQRTKAGEP